VNGPVLPLFAVVAGLVSFASPCCLPLLPGYISYISALPSDEVGQVRARRVALQSSLLFVLGFTLVFTALGLTATGAGRVLLAHRYGVSRVLGAVVVILGLVTVDVLRIPLLNRERRLDLARLPRGRAWALPTGMAFAAGWTPCLGPVLASILAVAAGSGQFGSGALLLVLYSAGLGVPFVALAVGFSRAKRSVAFLRRHSRAIERLGGLMLIAVGIGLVTGQWEELFRSLQRWAGDVGWPLL
jgi:cytochrome c-type biogenesis protein